MPFPDDLEWNQPGVEPTQAKKNEGWTPEEKPPAEYFNWFFNRTCRAVDFLKTESDKAIDDEKIGDRAIDDSIPAISGAGTITNLLSKLGNVIKRITGKSNWYTPPAISLEELCTRFWKPTHTYAVGDIVYSPNLPSYAYSECTIAGTTAATEPTWPAVDSNVTDDTVTWKVRDIKSGSGEQVGSIKAWLANAAPAGWLACDTGVLVSRVTYPQLWAWVQAKAPLITEAAWQAQAAVQSSVGYYSSGDGSTTFRLPRLVDFVRGSDATRLPGTWQADAMQNITGGINGFKPWASGGNAATGAFSITNTGAGSPDSTGTGTAAFDFDASRVVRTSNETRPKSITMLYCVKAFDSPINQGMIDITELANDVAVLQNSQLTGSIMQFLTRNVPTGYLKANGAAISRTAYANLVNNTYITIPTTGNKTSGSAIITNIPATIDMAIGMHVEGDGIPSGATITSINGLASITLSANLTTTEINGTLIVYPYGNGDGSTTVNLPDLRGEHLRAFDDGRNVDSTGFTLATTNGSAVISSIPDTSFMFVGMPLSGAGIPAGATVASITSLTSITISANATATSTKLVTFTGRRFGSWQSDDLKSHTHTMIVDGGSITGNQQIATNRANGTTGTTGGSETRGRNYAIPVYIKY